MTRNDLPQRQLGLPMEADCEGLVRGQYQVPLGGRPS